MMVTCSKEKQPSLLNHRNGTMLCIWRRYLAAMPNAAFSAESTAGGIEGGKECGSSEKFREQLQTFNRRMIKLGLQGTTLDSMVCDSVLDYVASFAGTAPSPHPIGVALIAWIERQERACVAWYLESAIVPLADAIKEEYIRQVCAPKSILSLMEDFTVAANAEAASKTPTGHNTGFSGLPGRRHVGSLKRKFDRRRLSVMVRMGESCNATRRIIQLHNESLNVAFPYKPYGQKAGDVLHGMLAPVLRERHGLVFSRCSSKRVFAFNSANDRVEQGSSYGDGGGPANCSSSAFPVSFSEVCCAHTPRDDLSAKRTRQVY
jgi:hypothetical protein